MPINNPACADCRAKKKRCIHRDQPVEVTGTQAVPSTMSSSSAPPPPPPPVPTPAATPAPVAPPGAATRSRRKAAEAAEAKAKEMSSAPGDSSDDLSSAPSETEAEAEKEPVVNKPTKRTRRAKATAAESQTGARGLPSDNLDAACSMSVHAMFASQLEENLQELERKMEAFHEAHRDGLVAPQALNDAHREAQAAGNKVQRTVKGWVQTWAVCGR